MELKLQLALLLGNSAESTSSRNPLTKSVDASFASLCARNARSRPQHLRNGGRRPGLAPRRPPFGPHPFDPAQPRSARALPLRIDVPLPKTAHRRLAVAERVPAAAAVQRGVAAVELEARVRAARRVVARLAAARRQRGAGALVRAAHAEAQALRAQDHGVAAGVDVAHLRRAALVHARRRRRRPALLPDDQRGGRRGAALRHDPRPPGRVPRAPQAREAGRARRRRRRRFGRARRRRRPDDRGGGQGGEPGLQPDDLPEGARRRRRDDGRGARQGRRRAHRRGVRHLVGGGPLRRRPGRRLVRLRAAQRRARREGRRRPRVRPRQGRHRGQRDHLQRPRRRRHPERRRPARLPEQDPRGDGLGAFCLPSPLPCPRPRAAVITS